METYKTEIKAIHFKIKHNIFSLNPYYFKLSSLYFFDKHHHQKKKQYSSGNNDISLNKRSLIIDFSIINLLHLFNSCIYTYILIHLMDMNIYDSILIYLFYLNIQYSFKYNNLIIK